ncbi:hypothetical protein HK096_008684, partial [Nowakowskiella sp. JEL0078]
MGNEKGTRIPIARFEVIHTQPFVDGRSSCVGIPERGQISARKRTGPPAAHTKTAAWKSPHTTNQIGILNEPAIEEAQPPGILCLCFRSKLCLPVTMPSPLRNLPGKDSSLAISILPFSLYLQSSSLDDALVSRSILSSIVNDISILLRLPFSEFWSTLLWPANLESSHLDILSFLDEYLSIKAQSISSYDSQSLSRISTDVDLHYQLSQKIFKVFSRIGLAPTSEAFHFSEGQWTVEKWSESVHQIVTLPRLMDFCTIYRRQENWGAIRNVVFSIWSCRIKEYGTDLHISAELFTKVVRAIQKKREKVAGGRKGKSRVDDPKNEQKPANKDIISELQYLGIIADSFYSLAIGGGKDIAYVLLENKNFLLSLLGCHQIGNVLKSDEEVGFIEKMKKSVLRLIDVLLVICFFEPLNIPNPEGSIIIPKVEVSRKDTYDSQELTILFDLTEKLCDFVMMLLDECHFDEPVTYLKDAPLIIDLEVEYTIGNRLRYLRDTLSKIENSDEARLNYLIISIEQMLTFSGNSDTRTKIIAEKKKINKTNENVIKPKLKVHEADEFLSTYDD